MATQQTIEVDNRSKFKVTFIQIDEYGEVAKVKLENEHEHRLLAENGFKTIWMSAERRKEYGLT